VLSLLLAAHLLCVNVASGGPLLAAWLDWRSMQGDEAAARAAVFLARASLVAFLAGAALGLLMGWLKWDADYRALWLGPMSYKLHWAGIEAIFSLVVMVGWWICLPGKTGGSFAAMVARGLAAALAATNLLYHFPVLFSVAAQLADAGKTGGDSIGGAGFRRLMVAGETPAIWVHVCLASIAVAGMMLICQAASARQQVDEPMAARIACWGGRWALVPSLLQFPVGLWTLAALPPAAQSHLMGESAIGTLLLVASLGTALWLINELVHVSFGDVKRTRLMSALAAMVVTVVLMTAMQQESRSSSRLQAPNTGESP
jgi:hypothetical protein